MASNMCRDGEVDYILEAIDVMEKAAIDANRGRMPLSLQYAYELARRAMQHDGVTASQNWIMAAEHELLRRKFDPDAY